MRIKEKNPRNRYEMDMCNGPILTKLLRFTLPLMLSGILQLVFNAADIIVVGKNCGDISLGAVGSNTALINLMVNLFMGIAVGVNVMVAKFYGAGKRGEVEETVHTAMVLSLIGGIVLTIVGEMFAKQLLILMQTPEKNLKLAVVYLRIYFLGMPAMMIYNFGSAILRAVGDTKRPLLFLTIAGIVNVGLNLLLVIVFRLDVAGVGIATVVSQIISAILVVICLMKNTGVVRLNIRKLAVKKDKVIGILRVGIPAGLQGTVFALSNVVIQSSINLFGEIVVAGNSAAASVEGFVYMAMNAFYHTTLSFVSQNYGAGKFKRIPKVLLAGEFCVIITGLALGWLTVLFSSQLLGIYTDSSAAIEAGKIRMLIICGTYALCGVMEVLTGAIRGMGYAIIPMVVSMIGACGLRLVWIATIFRIEKYHVLKTVLVSYPITWTITACTHLICFLIMYRMRTKRIKQYSGIS